MDGAANEASGGGAEPHEEGPAPSDSGPHIAAVEGAGASAAATNDLVGDADAGADAKVIALRTADGIERRFLAKSSPSDKIGTSVERFLRKEAALADYLLRDVVYAETRSIGALGAAAGLVDRWRDDVRAAEAAMTHLVAGVASGIDESVRLADALIDPAAVRLAVAPCFAGLVDAAETGAHEITELFAADARRLAGEWDTAGAGLAEQGRITQQAVRDLATPAWLVDASTAPWSAMDAAMAFSGVADTIRGTTLDSVSAYEAAMKGIAAEGGWLSEQARIGDSIAQALAQVIPGPVDATALLGNFGGIGDLTKGMLGDLHGLASASIDAANVAIAAWTTGILGDLQGLTTAWTDAANITIGPWRDADIPWLRPGTREGDLDLLLSATADPEVVLAALERTAERLVRYPRNPAARRALAARADEEGTSPPAVLRRETRAAVLLVLSQRDRPQRHRFGRAWVLDIDGKVAVVPINDLPATWFWDWLRREVPKAVAASLLERPYPPVDGDPWSRAPLGGVPAVVSLDAQPPSLVDVTGDPLEVLLVADRQREAACQLRRILDLATPRQREVLIMLATGVPLPDAARRLGMAPATARAHLHNLRRKVA